MITWKWTCPTCLNEHFLPDVREAVLLWCDNCARSVIYVPWQEDAKETSSQSSRELSASDLEYSNAYLLLDSDLQVLGRHQPAAVAYSIASATKDCAYVVSCRASYSTMKRTDGLMPGSDPVWVRVESVVPIELRNQRAVKPVV